MCRSTMAQAGESDGKVIQRLNDNEGQFARLTPDAVASQLPRLQVGPTPRAVWLVVHSGVEWASSAGLFCQAFVLWDHHQ